jgi:hypothetical protein
MAREVHPQQFTDHPAQRKCEESLSTRKSFVKPERFLHFER